MRTWGVLPGALVALVAFAGCSPTPAPEPVDTNPTMVDVGVNWSIEPSVALESDPWVIAARESDAGYRIANNLLDFTIEQFTETRTAEVARDQYSSWGATFNDNGEPVVYAGPSIMVPTELVVAPDAASAVVTFCEAPNWDWVIEDPPSPTYSLDSGRVTEFRLITAEGGKLVLDQRIPSTTTCEPSGAAVGMFDPVPRPRDGFDRDDVRAPLEG